MKLVERQLATMTFTPNEKEREAIELTCAYLQTIHRELRNRWHSVRFEFEDIDGDVVGGDCAFRDQWGTIAEVLDCFRWDVMATKTVDATVDKETDLEVA